MIRIRDHAVENIEQNRGLKFSAGKFDQRHAALSFKYLLHLCHGQTRTPDGALMHMEMSCRRHGGSRY